MNTAPLTNATTFDNGGHLTGMAGYLFARLRRSAEVGAEVEALAEAITSDGYPHATGRCGRVADAVRGELEAVTDGITSDELTPCVEELGFEDWEGLFTIADVDPVHVFGVAWDCDDLTNAALVAVAFDEWAVSVVVYPTFRATGRADVGAVVWAADTDD